MKQPNLELTWIGKDTRPKLEPRILLEYPARSHHAPHGAGDNDVVDNRRIFGNNLLALNALGAGSGILVQSDVRLHRSTVQNGQRLRALRRYGCALDLARPRVRSVQTVAPNPFTNGLVFCSIDTGDLLRTLTFAADALGPGHPIDPFRWTPNTQKAPLRAWWALK